MDSKSEYDASWFISETIEAKDVPSWQTPSTCIRKGFQQERQFFWKHDVATFLVVLVVLLCVI